ncbi:MAG: YbhB/YbcL family Raf kinase inhibitor-like protein [Gammaproteobacteria bacterium]|nr:YbhB/YbcL family Raf kinase inhibitor-like protein [Gammaproteobacteria bacterium]
MRTLALSTLAAMLVLPGAAGAAGTARFRLTSTDIKPNGVIANRFVFQGFGCKGDNVSPALSWSGAPPGTLSFALLVHDPDAPTGGAGWWHWVVYDIPASATSLAQGAGTANGAGLPQGAVQGMTDFGARGWGGPCPPEAGGTHHYHFTLYALKVAKLDVPDAASAALIGYVVNANSLGKAGFTGLYGR